MASNKNPHDYFECIGQQSYRIKPSKTPTLEEIQAFLRSCDHFFPLRLLPGIDVGRNQYPLQTNAVALRFYRDELFAFRFCLAWDGRRQLAKAIMFLLCELPRECEYRVVIDAHKENGMPCILKRKQLQRILDTYEHVGWTDWHFHGRDICKTLFESASIKILENCLLVAQDDSLARIMEQGVAWTQLEVKGGDPFTCLDQARCWRALQIRQLTLSLSSFVFRRYRLEIPTLEHLILVNCVLPFSFVDWLPETVTRLEVQVGPLAQRAVALPEPVLARLCRLPALHSLEFNATLVAPDVYVDSLRACPHLQRLTIHHVPRHQVEAILDIVPLQTLNQVRLQLDSGDWFPPRSLVWGVCRRLLQHDTTTALDILVDTKHVREILPAWKRVDSLLHDNRFLQRWHRIRNDAIALAALQVLPTTNAQVIFRCLRAKSSILFV